MLVLNTHVISELWRAGAGLMRAAISAVSHGMTLSIGSMADSAAMGFFAYVDEGECRS